MKRLQRIHHLFFIACTTAALFGAGVGLAQEMPVLPEPGTSNPGALSTDDEEGLIREIRLLPNHKRSLSLKEDERNVYARRTAELAINQAEDDGGKETESDRIRRVLTGLVVSGRTYSSKGIRLLAGDIIFEAGELVPQVLQDQTEMLMVENVTEEFVTIGWIDIETGELTGQRLTLTYDLSPRVGYVLAGQVIGGDKEGRKFGVMRRNTRPEQLADESDAREKEGSDSQLPNGLSQEIFNQAQ